MSKALRSALRAATPAPARSVGERLFAAGRVSIAAREDDGVRFAVSSGGGRNDVWLWADDGEWECDCEAPADGCAHAWAALEALEKGLDDLDEAEAPPALVIQLRRDDRWLAIGLAVRRGDTVSPVEGLPPGFELGKKLRHLLRLRRQWAGHRVPGRLNGVLLSALQEADEVMLDGQTITTSRLPVDPIAQVDRVGRGYRLRLVDPPEVEAIFEGEPNLVFGQGRLAPRGHGRMTDLQRHQLGPGLVFHEHELPRLTAEWLPALERAGLTVERSDGVPEARKAGLHALVELHRRGPTLQVVGRVVYGDPPVAEIRDGQLMPLGGVRALPPRDKRREAELVAQFDRMGLRAGRSRHLDGEEAARWVSGPFDGFGGIVIGEPAAESFRITGPGLQPSMKWGKDGLRVSFGDGEAIVGADRVLAAWQAGQRWVERPGGGWAALPDDWLGAHGDLLELAIAGSGRHLAPLAKKLMESTSTAPPPDLSGLVDALADGMPEVGPPEGLTATLRHYQLAGYGWMRFLAEQGLGAVLADDMGLGKTVQTLALLLDRRSKGPALVVAPTSLLGNWQAEARKFAPGLRVGRLHGPKRDREYASLDAGELDVLVTSYALLRLDKAELVGRRFATVVLDEAQAIKNADSQAARAARALRADARLALTGTPLENKLGELWSLFEYLNPGFFGAQRHFDERLAGPAAAGDPRAMALLRSRIRPFVLRRRKSEVATELPPRTETVLTAPMTEGQRAVYDATRRGALASLGGGAQKLAVLTALTRLRQAACDATLVPGDHGDPGSGKLDLLLHRLTECVDEGGRALVFSQWTSLLDRVEPRLVGAGLDFVRLDGSTRDRDGAVERFQDPDGPPVFLISLKAGGSGLNLTAADHVFHLDPWWNPAAEQQATDRAHRIGQTKPVFVWKLVSEDTVEERILILQDRKRALSEAVIEGQDGAASLGGDELLELLEGA